MLRNTLKGAGVGLGCGTIILLALMGILILFCIAPLFVGGIIWLGWNLAIAPIFSVAPINFFWQSIGLALLVMLVSSIFKGAVRATSRKDD
jgi:hypothetical protein